ncbi:MarR family transcriptional regulator [Streptomyces sp. SID3343]|uniref:MarR family winged helix-turn-helix transcriptional regulator n=1 Tax=Streptomyces sp. SID3343 TaxID=2690260 RepID=UPI0013722A9B|nr:MarR family transcriptional regulator [Streptomyces sp. SID3343]MYV97661.1 MarR family transcriptional regulator [Streptomyces sp. SID3343]
MTDVESRRRINEAITSIRRLMSSRRLDALHMERSGVPLGLVAIGVLHRIIDGGRIRPTELAERADIQPAALSRQIRILEEGGYTVRVTDPDDGRVSLLEATERGHEAYRLFVAANDELLARQLADWTAADLNDLADRMQRLVADLRDPIDND